MQPDNKDSEDLIRKIAKIVRILNGRDSTGQVIHPGLRMLRYLSVVFLANSIQMSRLGYGKEIDGSIYFTLYGLGQVADHFREIGPYHIAIQYDRTRVANRIYTILSDNGLVARRKIDGATYVSITEKGVDFLDKALQEL